MSQFKEYFKQSELALAAYAKDFLPDSVPELDKLEEADLSPIQAETFAAKYRVIDQHSDATGLSATVFKSTDPNNPQTFLAIRGTEITDVGDMLTNLVNIALFGDTTLHPQYISLKSKVQEWIADEKLPQNFTVTGHSLGGFLATDLAIDSDFASNITHAYLYNTPGQSGVFGDLINMMQNAWGIPTQYDPAKFSNIEAVVSDGFNISPIAGLGYDVSPPIEIIIENQLNLDVINVPNAKKHSQQVLTDTPNIRSLYSLNLSSVYGWAGSVIKKTSNLLVLQISLFFILLLLCLNSMAQDTNCKGTSPMNNSTQNLLEICQHKITDYQSLKIEIEERYAVGSSVTLLQSDFEQYFGTLKKKKLTKDAYFMKDKNEDANSWIYYYNKTCDYAPLYSVLWNIYILTDLAKKITAINLKPIIQTTELGLINVPFNFNFFENADDMKKALWSLTGVGTKKNEILELMLVVGGEYGDLETIKIKNPEKRLGYRYRYNANTFIASRIAAYEFSYVVIWEFNDQDELINLSVNNRSVN